jgi:hypothetical protein
VTNVDATVLATVTGCARSATAIVTALNSGKNVWVFCFYIFIKFVFCFLFRIISDRTGRAGPEIFQLFFPQRYTAPPPTFFSMFGFGLVFMPQK